MTKLPKSRLAIVVAVVAVSVIGVAAVMLSSGGDETPPLVPDEAIANYDSFVSVSDVRFEMTTLAPGEVPLSSHGIVFIDTEDGSQEVWTVSELPVPDRAPLAYYDVEATHRWVLFGWGADKLVADRRTGTTYLLQGWLAFGPTPDGRLILQTGPGPGAFQYEDEVPDFVLITLGAPEETVEFTVPGAQIRSSATLLGDRRHVVASGAVVDVETGEVNRFGSPAADRPEHNTYAAGDGGAIAVESRADEVRIWRFDETGGLQHQLLFDRDHAHRFLPSPDGRWVALQGTLPLHTFPFYDFWPVVTMIDLQTGKVIVRALRASSEVALDELQWLSDSSGLVVDSASGFVVLSPQGAVQRLSEAFWLYAPVPASPNGAVIDGLPGVGALQSLWSASTPQPEYNRFTYGFDETGTEAYLKKESPFYADWLIFPLTQPSLPVSVQHAPFSDEVRLRVATGGEGLNVRRAPGASRERLGALADGTIVVATNGPNEVPNQCIPEIGCSAAMDVDSGPGPDAPWWIQVRSAEGLEGWVAAEYLTWAD